MLELFGLMRSLVVYWRPGRQRSLRRLYAPFVGEGDLVFDVGAHLGDRSVAFAALGARVVALEPQPHVARWLRRIAGRSERIVVREEAVGAEPGRATLAISSRTPTVSTLSREWRDRVTSENPGFRSVRWQRTVDVPVVTLDGLIEEYGEPTFCKIDVEGYEAEALSGLTRPVRSLSFEFVPGDLDTAAACVRRLHTLGPYRFNLILGEGRDFELGEWRTAEGMLSWLEGGAAGGASGDVYARLPTGAERSSHGGTDDDETERVDEPARLGETRTPAPKETP